jgi:hypothetical protein
MNILQFPRTALTTPRWIPSQLPAPAGLNPQPQPAAPSLFACLVSKRVLLLIDDDNLRVSNQNALRKSFSYRALANELDRITRCCDKFAFFSSAPGDHSRQQYFSRRGYNTLDLKREFESRPGGRITANSNADFDLAVQGGYLLSLCRYDCVLVGSGDGDLVLAIARGVQRLLPDVRVFTLSVPGCTSHRILASKTSLIAANFLVEDSMLRALPSGKKSGSHHLRPAGARHVS